MPPASGRRGRSPRHRRLPIRRRGADRSHDAPTTCAGRSRGSSTRDRCSSCRPAGRGTSSPRSRESMAVRSGSSPTSRAISGECSMQRARRRPPGSCGCCDSFSVPLVAIVDTPGFMPGSRQEQAGVIRHGASLVRAFAAARVPKLTVVLRKSYGGAYITMNSRDLGADLVLAWPEAEVGIMSARAAVSIINRRELNVARGPRRRAHAPRRRVRRRASARRCGRGGRLRG